VSQEAEVYGWDIAPERIESNLKKILGKWGEVDTFPVELVNVRRMGLVVEDFDPIHYEVPAARAKGFRGIVAPWPFLWTIIHNLLPGEMPFTFGNATVHGHDEYELYEPMIVGDTIALETNNIDCQLKHGRNGPLGYVLTERRFTNQLGQLCAVVRTSTFRK
jgi:acyl dehydratase